MDRPQPVLVNVAIGLVISTGVKLLSGFFPEVITPDRQILILTFADAVIALGVIIVTKAQVTPKDKPKVEEGTPLIITEPGTGKTIGTATATTNGGYSI
jgi:hypothetical protein